MARRYENVLSFKNNLELYTSVFEDRGVPFINQYRCAMFTQPSAAQLRRLNNTTVIWQVGDRLEKLAAKYYGNSTFWWVIARYNQKPTDAHFALGDTVFVPQPLALVLDLYL